GFDRAFLVALRDEVQWTVELVHFVDEHREVHGARLGHVVVGLPGAVVLVPLPDVAVERGLPVDLELVDVGPVPEQLLGRLDEARAVHQRLEHRMIGVHGEGGAHHVAGLLADILLAALLEDAGNFRLQDLRLLRREIIRKEEISLVVELLELLRGELHGGSSFALSSYAACEITAFSRPIRMSAICSTWLRQSASASTASPASSVFRMTSCSSQTLTRMSSSLSAAAITRRRCCQCGWAVSPISGLPDA